MTNIEIAQTNDMDPMYISPGSLPEDVVSDFRYMQYKVPFQDVIEMCEIIGKGVEEV